MKLFVKDIFGATKKKDGSWPTVNINGETLPFPFEDLLEFEAGAREDQVIKHQLENKLSELDLNRLELKGDTRWCSLSAMFKTLREEVEEEEEEH